MSTIKESCEKISRLIGLGLNPNAFSSINVFNAVDIIDKTMSSRVACIFEPKDNDELITVADNLIKIGFEQHVVMPSKKNKYACFKLDEISVQIKIPIN